MLLRAGVCRLREKLAHSITSLAPALTLTTRAIVRKEGGGRILFISCHGACLMHTRAVICHRAWTCAPSIQKARKSTSAPSGLQRRSFRRWKTQMFWYQRGAHSLLFMTVFTIQVKRGVDIVRKSIFQKAKRRRQRSFLAPN